MKVIESGSHSSAARKTYVRPDSGCVAHHHGDNIERGERGECTTKLFPAQLWSGSQTDNVPGVATCKPVSDCFPHHRATDGSGYAP